MALTSWTPTGALSKITQFTMGAIDRVNPATNLIPATMTAEISSNASNLLSDIKPGYMLGAKPRQQAIGHVIGILAGTLATVPLFFLLFLPPGPDGTRSPSTIVSEQFAMPAAVQWKGVADLITNGLSQLPASAVISMIVAAVLAVVFEVARIRTKGAFPALRSLDRTWCRAAAGVVHRDVGGRDDLLVAGAEEARARVRARTRSGSRAMSRSARDSFPGPLLSGSATRS